MIFTRFLPALALAGCLTLFAACNGDDDDGPTPTPGSSDGGTPVSTPTPTVEVAPTQSGGSGFGGGVNPVEAPVPSGMEQATLVNVRAAAQTGFDRIVFEFNGSQVPGYRVEYAEEAIACGSGQDLTEFIGDGEKPAGLMLVRLDNTVSHDEAGQPTAVRALRADLGSIVHAFRTCDFEGVVAYGISISDEQPFKVSTLNDPPRLVIDIAQ